MVEQIMYFGIGFLVAGLFALMFVPLVHNRAVRLTMRRLEAATPLTMAEIRADKDQLRAEFAMSTRRLELSVEQMKTKTVAQLAELGKKTEAVNLLKKELGEKVAAYFALEARDKALADQLRVSEEEFGQKNSALHNAERALADKEAELTKLVAELGDQSIQADSQRVELAALRTQVEAMKVNVADYERTMNEAQERLARERSDSATAVSNLDDARRKVENLGTRTADLERQLIAQTTETELLNKRTQELEVRLGDQGRLLAERDFEIERVRGEAETARKVESDLRAELAAAGKRSSGAAAKFKSDVAELESQLAAALAERTKLQAEIAELKREAEASWASERVENALLRERINDVAAEVARLTAALEGPDSPIEMLLGTGEYDVSHAGSRETNGGPATGRYDQRGEAGPARIEPAAEQRSTLADRIRALQSTASRMPSTAN